MRTSLLLPVLLLPVLAHAQAPPLTLTSPNPHGNGEFGTAVSEVPDADGDGISDLLVGTRENRGKAYLFSGATGERIHTLRSPTQNRGFGNAVAGLPDVDGDGRGDLLVGASAERRVHVFSGATGTRLRVLFSPNPDPGNFGQAVSEVPDTDGDGVYDFLVGANHEEGFIGRAYLFSGATGALLHTLESPNAQNTDRNSGFSSYFGYAVSGVPDADDDGRGDLLVSAIWETVDGVVQAGRAYLFSGATGALLHTLESPMPYLYGNFGDSVSGVEDADGDGRGDLLVGHYIDAYFFSGATGALLYNLNPSAGAVSGVSGVPDANGDGRGDLLIGARFARQAFLYSGATSALLRTIETPNPDPNGFFGHAVSGVEDVDGDGRGDLFIGAYQENVGGYSDAGRAYLFPSGGGILLTASGTPTTIPPGGTVTVAVTITNTTAQPTLLDLWVVAERISDPVLTRFIGSGTLPSGATVTRQFSLIAPGNTPPGLYTVTVNAGTFPNTALATDAFDVTVIGSRLAGGLSVEPFVVAPLSGDVFAAGEPASSAAALPPSVVVSPNPFAGQTVLRFSLAEAGPVRLSVYDVLGREVAVLADGMQEAGAHTAVFDAAGLASGVYVWRLAAGGAVQTGRLTLLE